LIEQARAGKIELAYMDEAGFTPQPPNRSAWTKKDEVHAITAKCSQRLNIMGGFAILGKVGDGEAVAVRERIMILWFFDGLGVKRQQTARGDSGQCFRAYRQKTEAVLGTTG
jgi:hypothetical protein